MAAIEVLDVVEDLGLRLLARDKGLVVGELLLEGAEEALHGRVVIGHAFATHTCRGPASCSCC